MKGIMVNCLKKLVVEKFGDDKWEEILETSGLDTTLAIHPMENIDDTFLIPPVKFSISHSNKQRMHSENIGSISSHLKYIRYIIKM